MGVAVLDCVFVVAVFVVAVFAVAGFALAGVGFGPAVCLPLGVGEGFACAPPAVFAAFCAAAAVAMTVASARI